MALFSSAFLGAGLVAALAAALGPWALAHPLFMEPGEAKDVMVRLGKVEAQLRTVTQRLSGLASQKDLDELRRKNQALEASARRLEELEGAARDADARLRQQKGRAEESNAEL